LPQVPLDAVALTYDYLPDSARHNAFASSDPGLAGCREIGREWLEGTVSWQLI
jgi:hypothetical protein